MLFFLFTLLSTSPAIGALTLSSCFLGDYGSHAKKTIKRLLKEHLITFMGTDIHHKKENYNFAEKAKKKFSKYLTEDEINDIFENNARKLLNK